MKEIKIRKEDLENLHYDINTEIPSNYIVPCDCGFPECTGEKIIHVED